MKRRFFIMKPKFPKVKDSLLYIGLIVFSLTILVQHLFSIATDLTGFFMGLGCGLQLVGVFVLMKKRCIQTN